MKGLLIKEARVLGYYKNSFIMMLAMAALLSFLMTSSLSFLSTLFVMYLLMMTPSMFQMDETAKWDVYAAALPIKRRTLVAARYLFLLMALGCVMLLSTALGAVLTLVQRGGFEGFATTLASMGAGVMVYLFVSAIALPACYKLGAQKSRFVMVVFTVIPYLVVIMVLNWFESGAVTFTPLVMTVLIAGVAALCAAAFIASYFVSCRFYEKKEF